METLLTPLGSCLLGYTMTYDRLYGSSAATVMEAATIYMQKLISAACFSCFVFGMSFHVVCNCKYHKC